MASDQALSREGDGQQRAALRERVTGRGPQGLISPNRRMFFTAPAGGLIPLVPTRPAA